LGIHTFMGTKLVLCCLFSAAPGCKGKSEPTDKDRPSGIATATSLPSPVAAKSVEAPSAEPAGRVQAFQQLHIQLTLPVDVDGHVEDVTDDARKPDLTLFLRFKNLDYQLSCHAGSADEVSPPQLDGVKVHEDHADGWAMIWVDKSTPGAVNYTVACYRAASKIACSSALSAEHADPAPLEAGAKRMVAICKTIRPL
jgi:hypothetical protein